MKKMLSFHGNKHLKKILLEEIKEHEKADQIIQGVYSSNSGRKWRGCAVGCSIHSLNVKLGKEYYEGDHSVYETELGIPRVLARLE